MSRLYLLSFTVSLLAYSCGSKSKISLITKSKAGLSSASSKSLSPISAKPGETVKIMGEGFDARQTIAVKLTGLDNVSKTAAVSVANATEASFVMPEGLGLGLKSVVMTVDGKESTEALRMVADGDANTLPIFVGDQSEVCSTLQYIDKNGVAQTGTKDCTAGTVVADCAADGALGCKTNASYPAVSASLAIAANIKAGVTLAGVSGSFSGSYSACSSNGEQSCIAAGSYYAGAACAANGDNCFLPTYSVTTQPLKAISYNAIDQTKMLDSLALAGITGTVTTRGALNLTNSFPGAGYYSSASNTPSASTIASGTTINGVAGSATLSPANCSTAGQQSCVATGTYFAGTACSANGSACYLPTYASGSQDKKAIDYSTIDASKMLSTLTISGVSGSITNQGSWDLTASFPGAGYYSGTSNTPSAATIATSTTIAGVAGSATLAPSNCSSAGQQSCVATGTYYAGTACSANGSACYVPTYAATTQPLKAIDYDNISSNAAKMRSSLTVAAVAGTLADCSANGTAGCVTTSTYVSGDLTNLTEGNVKNGVTIAGVAGLYPNSTYTLPSASGTADLDAATFNAKVKSATAFEYWDASGARQAGAGDADIAAGNISSGIDIFGTSGSASGGTAPSAWDVRAGTVVNGVTGKLKINCRNTIANSLFNYDGAVGILGNSGTISGITLDLWDTIDDYNNGVTSPMLPAATVSGWSTTTNCGGIESTSGDDNVWKDVTTAGTGAATCAGSPENCTYQDKISGLWYSKQQSSGSAWDEAVSTCDVLSFNGQTDWRLPTQKELMSAYEHGMRSTQSANFVEEFYIAFWSASTRSDDTTYAWLVYLGYGTTYYTSKTDSYYVVCVR